MSGYGTVNPQIPLGGQTPQQPNPLEMLGQYAQTGNALQQMQQNRLLLQSKQALAAAYQQVPIDPTTGLPNSNALVAALQKTPGGGLALPQVIPGLQAQQKTQYELQQAGLSLAAARNSALGTALGPLLAKGNNITFSDVTSAIQRMHAAGYDTTDMADQVAASVPTIDPMKANDPQAQAAYGGQLHNWVVNTWGSSLSPADQARLFAPQVTSQDTGGGVTLYDANPYTNPGVVGTTFSKTLSPSDAASQVPGPPTATGAPTVQSKAAYAAGNGLGGLVYGGAPGQQGGSPLGTGRLPPALLPPGYAGPGALRSGAPQAAAAASPFSGAGMGAGGWGPVPIAPMPTGLGPAQAAALTSAGTEGQNQANALTNSAQDVPGRQAILQGLLGDLTQFKTGPGSGSFLSLNGRMVQALQMLGVTAPPGAAAQASGENFTKLANQYLARQASMLGPVTNDKLALAAESGPNSMFSTLGNEAVIHIGQANEDALNVKNQAWLNAQRTQSLTGADFPSWSANFNQSFAPSAFWYARMSPPERQRFIAGMSPQDRATLQQSIVGAIDRGWIDPATLGMPQVGAAAGASNGQ